MASGLEEEEEEEEEAETGKLSKAKHGVLLDFPDRSALLEPDITLERSDEIAIWPSLLHLAAQPKTFKVRIAAVEELVNLADGKPTHQLGYGRSPAASLDSGRQECISKPAVTALNGWNWSTRLQHGRRPPQAQQQGSVAKEETQEGGRDVPRTPSAALSARPRSAPPSITLNAYIATLDDAASPRPLLVSRFTPRQRPASAAVSGPASAHAHRSAPGRGRGSNADGLVSLPLYARPSHPGGHLSPSHHPSSGEQSSSQTPLTHRDADAINAAAAEFVSEQQRKGERARGALGALESNAIEPRRAAAFQLTLREAHRHRYVPPEPKLEIVTAGEAIKKEETFTRYVWTLDDSIWRPRLAWSDSNPSCASLLPQTQDQKSRSARTRAARPLSSPSIFGTILPFHA